MELAVAAVPIRNLIIVHVYFIRSIYQLFIFELCRLIWRVNFHSQGSSVYLPAVAMRLFCTKMSDNGYFLCKRVQ